MADTSSFTNDGQNSISSHSSYSDSDSESSVETVIAGYQKSRSRRANKSLGKDGEKEPATKNAMTGKISKTPTDTIEKVTTHSSGRSQENFSPVGESSRTTRYGHGVAAANMKTAINAAAQSYSTLPTPSASTPAALAVMHMQVSDRSGFNRGTGSTIALQLPTATVSRPALRRAQTVASGVHSPGGALRAAGALSIVPSVGSSMSAALAGEEVGHRMLRSEVPDDLIDGVERLVDAQCRLRAPHFAQQTIHSLIQSAAVVHPRPLHDEHAHKEHGDGSHGSAVGGAVHPHSHHHSSHQHHHHDGSAARGQHHRAPSVGTDGAGGGGAAAAAGGDHAHHVRGNPSRTGATGNHNVPSGGGGHPGAGASDKDSTKSVGSRGGSVSPNSGNTHHRDGTVDGQLDSVRSPRVHDV